MTKVIFSFLALLVALAAAAASAQEPPPACQGKVFVGSTEYSVPYETFEDWAPPAQSIPLSSQPWELSFTFPAHAGWAVEVKNGEPWGPPLWRLQFPEGTQRLEIAPPPPERAGGEEYWYTFHSVKEGKDCYATLAVTWQYQYFFPFAAR